VILVVVRDDHAARPHRIEITREIGAGMSEAGVHQDASHEVRADIVADDPADAREEADARDVTVRVQGDHGRMLDGRLGIHEGPGPRTGPLRTRAVATC
jgi:hypothetical protein